MKVNIWLDDFSKVKPKPINYYWVWVCIKCETPIVIMNGKYYYGCDCNKKIEEDDYDKICFNGNHSHKNGICVVDGGIKYSDQ